MKELESRMATGRRCMSMACQPSPHRKAKNFKTPVALTLGRGNILKLKANFTATPLSKPSVNFN